MHSSCQESGSIYLRCGCWHLRDERPDHAKLCGLRGRSFQAASAPTWSFVYAFAALGLSLPGWPRHRARRARRRCRRVKQESQESLQVWFEQILSFLKVVEEMTLEEIGCLPARQALSTCGAQRVKVMNAVACLFQLHPDCIPTTQNLSRAGIPSRRFILSTVFCHPWGIRAGINRQRYCWNQVVFQNAVLIL